MTAKKLQSAFLKEVEREVDFLKSYLTALEKSRLKIIKKSEKVKGKKITVLGTNLEIKISAHRTNHKSIYSVACGWLSKRHQELITDFQPHFRTNCSSTSKSIIYEPYDSSQIGFGSYSTCLDFYLCYLSTVTPELLEYIKGKTTFFPELVNGRVEGYFGKLKNVDRYVIKDFVRQEVKQAREVVEVDEWEVKEDLERRLANMMR